MDAFWRLSLMSLLTGILLKAGNTLKTYLLDVPNKVYSFFSTQATGTSGIRLATDRGIDQRKDSVYVNEDNWLHPSGSVTDYEVKCTVAPGGAALEGTSSATDVFLNFSTNRSWQIESTGGNIQSCVLTFNIRSIADNTDTITFDVSLIANSTGP